jgi:hypothetical protein
MFIRLDLPTFERPMKAYSGFLSGGHIETVGALIVNSAVLISIIKSYFCVQSYEKKTKFFAVSKIIRNFAFDF